MVFFSREITPESLLKFYEALGRPAEGKTGVKISFESPNGPHLNPALLKPRCDKVEGTLIDSNGFTGPRDTTSGNLRVAEGNGFRGIAPIDILDSDGDMDPPSRTAIGSSSRARGGILLNTNPSSPSSASRPTTCRATAAQ